MSGLTKKPLPIGISDFKKVIDEGYFYVDKTLLIQDVIEKGTEVALIPRPRRFGKTLNLSMLRYFFEKKPYDTSYLFKNLQIWKQEKYRALQGQFPVVCISLKDVKHSSLDKALSAFRKLLAKELEQHQYVQEVLTEREKKLFHKILFEDTDPLLVEDSLLLLSEWLHRYHKKRVILLVDEYDTPAHAAYMGGYYEPMIEILRNWISKSFKDNSHLERGVLTGILRIAKESIFSGANNMSTFTVLHESFADHFGLLETEVQGLLEEYGLKSQLLAIRQWYDGYWMGSRQGMYNPWSVLKCIAGGGELSPHWVNTSENALMKHLIAQGSEDLKVDLEQLLQGGTIEKTIEEGLLFSNLEKNSNAIWSLLLYSGYVTLATTPIATKPCRLRIPNAEVYDLYHKMIVDWFTTSIQEHKYRLLLESLTKGDVDTFSQIFKEFMMSSVSVFDVPSEESEKVYHAFILGMLVGLQDRYEVKSNRESGLGRYDVLLVPKDRRHLGIVMEFKKVGRFEEMELDAAVASALQQIQDKNYAQELLNRGIDRILYLGFAFKGKQVSIRSRLRQ